jgi:hypothetical protein
VTQLGPNRALLQKYGSDFYQRSLVKTAKLKVPPKAKGVSRVKEILTGTRAAKMKESLRDAMKVQKELKSEATKSIAARTGVGLAGVGGLAGVTYAAAKPRIKEKTASLPPALLRILAPAASGALIYADQRHREKQLHEAMVLNEMFRHLEAQRQSETIAGFRGKGQMLSHQGQAAQSLNPMRAYQQMMALNQGGMERYASVSGATLARLAVSNPALLLELEKQGMNKEAIGLLRGLASGAKSLLGGGATKRLTQAALKGGAATAPMTRAATKATTRAITPASTRAARALGRGVGGIGSAVGGAARGVGRAATATGRAIRGPAGAVTPRSARAFQAIGRGMGKVAPGIGAAGRATGRGLLRAGAATGRGIGRAGAATGRGVWRATAATGRAAGRAGMATGRAALGAGRATGRAAKRLFARPAAGAGRAAAPAAAAAKPAVTEAAKATTKRKPLLSWKTKGKILGAGALGLGGYAGYKGLQTTRDYMMQPTYASNAWGGQGQMPGQLSQYGYTGVVR